LFFIIKKRNILEEYFYDSSGDRIKINRYSYSGGTNETIYTPYKEWMQIRNSSGTYNFFYIYQDGVLVAQVDANGNKQAVHNDHLGSASLVTDSNGNIVENNFYSPFGENIDIVAVSRFTYETKNMIKRSRIWIFTLGSIIQR